MVFSLPPFNSPCSKKQRLPDEYRVSVTGGLSAEIKKSSCQLYVALLADDRRYKIVHGVFIMTPVPEIPHQGRCVCTKIFFTVIHTGRFSRPAGYGASAVFIIIEPRDTISPCKYTLTMYDSVSCTQLIKESHGQRLAKALTFLDPRSSVYLKLRRETGDIKPGVIPERPAKKDAALLAGLQPQLDAYPGATLVAHCQMWESTQKMPISSATVRSDV
jgi:hypothetical protein